MNKEENFNSIYPPVNTPEKRIINVKGRQEHEELLRDSHRMYALGLDPVYEKLVYLKRWGSWLNGSINYTGYIKK